MNSESLTLGASDGRTGYDREINILADFFFPVSEKLLEELKPSFLISIRGVKG